MIIYYANAHIIMRPGPGPGLIIKVPGLGQARMSVAGPGRARASNLICGPGQRAKARPVQGPTEHCGHVCVPAFVCISECVHAWTQQRVSFIVGCRDGCLRGHAALYYSAGPECVRGRTYKVG